MNLRRIIFFLLFFVIILSLRSQSFCLAQDKQQLTALSKAIVEEKDEAGLISSFSALSELYFKENKYNELIDLLKSLIKQKAPLEATADYYMALCRYEQLKYLESTQDWNLYFANADTYRQEIKSLIHKSLASLNPCDKLKILSELLLWKFNKEQDNAQAESDLVTLENSVFEYANCSKDISLIKYSADEMLSFGEKAKAKKIYKLYTEKLISQDSKEEELAKIAQDAFSEGNLDLSEQAYNIYIDKLLKSDDKNKQAQLLAQVAQKFAYNDLGLHDEAFAEEIFAKIDALNIKDGLGEESLYLRAFNLEKYKDLKKAKEIYEQLILQYPLSLRVDEALFKSGIISAYVLGDLNSAKSNFNKLIEKEKTSVHTISAFYQLALINQWEEKLDESTTLYNKLIEKAGQAYSDLVANAKVRLAEIKESKSIDFKLKVFLDASLKPKEENLGEGSCSIKITPYNAKIKSDVTISATPSLGPTGCMSVELEYFWSGDLGTSSIENNQQSFVTQYPQAGTKVVNIVLMSPNGMIAKEIGFVDVK